MACSRSTLLCVVPTLCRRTRREKSRRQGRCRRPRRRRASPTPPRRLRPRHARLGKIEVLIYWLVIVKRIVTGYNVNEEWRMKSVRELAPRTKKTLAFAPPRPACAGAALAPLRYALPPYGGWQRAWAASTWAFRRGASDVVIFVLQDCPAGLRFSRRDHESLRSRAAGTGGPGLPRRRSLPGLLLALLALPPRASAAR